MENTLFDREPRIYVSKTDFINGISCPYTWYLRKVMGVKGIITSNMVEGTNLHSLMKGINSLRDESVVEEYIRGLIRKNKEFEVELNNVLNFIMDRRNKGLKVLPKHSEFEVEVISGKFVLYGIIDAVYVNDDYVEIFEYKKSFYRKESDLFDEVAFYSYLFSKFKKVKVDRMGVFSFLTGEVKYKEFVEEEIYEKIMFFLDKVNRGDFNATPSKETCSFCVFRNNCKFSFFNNSNP